MDEEEEFFKFLKNGSSKDSHGKIVFTQEDYDHIFQALAKLNREEKKKRRDLFEKLLLVKMYMGFADNARPSPQQNAQSIDDFIQKVIDEPDILDKMHVLNLYLLSDLIRHLDAGKKPPTN